MRDYLGYSGKVCVVTGASSGMGASLAEMLIVSMANSAIIIFFIVVFILNGL